MAPLRVTTLNTHNLTDPNKMLHIFSAVKTDDIVCLTETNFNHTAFLTRFDGIFSRNFKTFHSFSQQRGTGVSLLINHATLGTDFRKVLEIRGRAVGIAYKRDCEVVLVLGVYAPATSQQRIPFFGDLEALLRTIAAYDRVFFVGDHNVVEDHGRDRSGLNQRPDVGAHEFLRVKNLLGVVDVDEQGGKFSFFSAPHKTFSRIDRIYCDVETAASVVTCDYVDVSYSDHCLVRAAFSDDRNLRGPSYWKLDSDILADELVRSIIGSMIDEISQPGVIDGQILPKTWETFKANLRQILKVKGAKIQKKQNMDSHRAEGRVFQAKRAYSQNPRSLACREKLKQMESELKFFEHQKAQKMISRSHYRDVISDEISLNDAKRLLKKSAEARHIYEMRREDGSTVTDTFELLEEIRDQYEKVFEDPSLGVNIDDTGLLDFLQNIVPNADRGALDGPINQEEIKTAVSLFKAGKTPGSDGIPVEFYKSFIDTLAPILEKLFERCLEQESLTPSMYSGVISLLYKGSGDRLDRSRWRPLTMLGVDYKILTKILMLRMQKVMNGLVDPAQSCAVKGRSIQDSILALYNVVEGAICENKPCLILSVDHMAAFDRIRWDYIHAVLEKCGFGPVFRAWIKLIYKPGLVCSSVQVNGFISAPFHPERGIRQGCPLSALLYVLAGEAVLSRIRMDPLIRGVVIGNREEKLIGYADDTNMLLASFRCIGRIFNIYAECEPITGARLEWTKTKILSVIGDENDVVDLRFERFVVNEMKILGVIITSDGITGQSNFRDFHDVIQAFNRRPPLVWTSTEAKCHSFDTFILSKLWHRAFVAKVQDKLIKGVYKSLDSFLKYPNATNKVAREKMMLPKIDGGVGYPDVVIKIMCMKLMTLVKRAKSREVLRWHHIFDIFWDRARALNRRQILTDNIPQLYKDIKIASLTARFHILADGSVEIGLNQTRFLLRSVRLRDLYAVLTREKHGKKLDNTVGKWRLALPGIEILPFFRLCNNRAVDSYSKDIHYHLIHRALFTRERTKHFAGTGEFCKLCGLRGRSVVENVEHVFVYCPRAQILWNTVARLLAGLHGRNVSVEDKIFGVIIDEKKILEMYNMIIQSAQAAIWRVRNILEYKDEKICVVTIFRRILSSAAWRLYLSRSSGFSVLVEKNVVSIRNSRMFVHV